MSSINARPKRAHAITIALLAAASIPALAQTLPAPPASPTPVTTLEYDPNGNSTRTTQGPGQVTVHGYDILNRRAMTTDALSGVVRYGFDGQDRLTVVQDPRLLYTQYPRNGLGDATSLISPDTGTASHTYDGAGNLKTRVDSRGVTATYTYDAVNRLRSIAYSQSGQTTLTHSYTYDQTGGTFGSGIGRLTSATHAGGSTSYGYDAQGRVVSELQSLSRQSGANNSAVNHSVGYGYDGAGNVTSIAYPSGRRLTIAYSAGVPTSLSLAKDASTAPVTLLSAIQWEPFGAAKSWLWQMNSGTQLHERIHDSDGRVVRYRLGNSVRDLSYDAGDRIEGYMHYDASSGAAQANLAQSFAYDTLGRLTGVLTASNSWNIGYDASGNRTSVLADGASSNSYTTASNSNRLMNTTSPARNFAYDNAGNTTGDGLFTSTFTLAGRMATLSKAGVSTTYSVDAFGRRVRKFSSTGKASTVIYVYDQQGQLLGEYDSAGVALREYVWLNSTPVAVFTPDPTGATKPPLVYYIHTDHLDAPRVVVDKNNAARWSWLAEPFGTTAANGNPSGLGAFSFSLRLPGQVFDAESGLHYNVFRDYDAGSGRYVQSDPIGLAGGINTYAYVGGNPLTYYDPYGLFDIRNAATWPSIPNGLVDFFEGYGSYYSGLGSAGVHMYRRSGLAGACRQRRAIENEAALAVALLSLSNPVAASQAASAANYWASNHKAYLGGRLSAGGIISTLTGVGPYGGLSLGLVAGMGDALHNIDRANASSAEQVLRSIMGDRMPSLPDIRRTECECSR